MFACSSATNCILIYNKPATNDRLRDLAVEDRKIEVASTVRTFRVPYVHVSMRL